MSRTRRTEGSKEKRSCAMAGSVNRAGLPETGTCTSQRRGQASKTAAGRQRTTAGEGAPTLTPRTACYGEGNSKTPLHPHTSRARASTARRQHKLPEASGIAAEWPRRAPPGSGQSPGSPTAPAGTPESLGRQTILQFKKQGLPERLDKITVFTRRSPCTTNSVSSTSLASSAVRNGCAVSGAGSEQPMPAPHEARA